MGIKYNKYNNLTGYLARNYSSKRHLNANKLTLIRGALIVGTAPRGHLVFSKELIDWKISTICTFVDSNRPFSIKNIDQLEISEKANVAYFIGMVFAQIHMQIIYNVRHLEHLSNTNISMLRYNKGDLQIPDLWGICNKTGISYLVEAKGSTTSMDYFSNSVVRKAISQLNVVRQINYTIPLTISNIYSQHNNNLERLVIATHPDSNGEIMQQIIDPREGKEKIIDIDGNELVYKYYINLIKILQAEETEKINIMNLQFRVIKLNTNNYSIGILEEIYQLYDSEIKSEIHFRVNKVLDKLEEIYINEFENEMYSIGIDGVIVLENNKEKK